MWISTNDVEKGLCPFWRFGGKGLGMDKVLIGEVLKPHGLHGELKIYPITHDTERFRNLGEVFLAKAGAEKCFQVQNVRVHPDFVYLTLAGITAMDEAEKYRNWEVRIDRRDVPPLAEGWYYFELEGMHVFEGETYLGILVQVIATGSNDVYIVKGPYGEVCIPALKSVVQKVNVPEKRMDVILPPGLLDDGIE